MSYDELMAAARDAAKSAVWSKGVALARASKVRPKVDRGDELEFRVAQPLGRPAIAVFVYPKDEDWSCDCPSKFEICEHAVACVVALKQSSENLFSKDSQDTRPHGGNLSYALFRAAGALGFRRSLDSKVIELSLEKLRRRNPDLLITSEDMRVERALGALTHGVIPKARLENILEALSKCENVKLDGKAIQILDPHPGLRAVLSSVSEGSHLRVEVDPTIRETFSNGAMLFEQGIAAHQSALPFRQDLPRLKEGIFFPNRERAQLVNGWLPRIEGSIPLIRDDSTLPKQVELHPRIDCALDFKKDGTLELLCTLVYGTPAIARVDGESLHCFGNAVPKRELRQERRLRDRLNQSLGVYIGHTAKIENRNIPDTLQQLDSLGKQPSLQQPSPQAWLKPQTTQLLPLGGAAIPVEFQTPAGQKISTGSMLNAHQRGQKFLALEDGTVVELPATWLEQHGAMLSDLLRALKSNSSPAAVKHWSTAFEQQLQGTTPQYSLKERLDSAKDEALPHLEVTLRGYQRDAVKWMRRQLNAGIGVLLADDMGLGKTIQALAALEGRTLVVCPTSVMNNWELDAQKTYPGLLSSRYHGPKRNIGREKLVVTSYAIARSDYEELNTVGFDTIILDEAHVIKNARAQTTTSILQLKAPRRIALSGTPIENRPEEIWPVMEFCNPGLFGSYAAFQTTYAKPATDEDDIIRHHALSQLKQRITPLYVRRKKEDVAKDLPSRSDMVLWCDLEGQNKKTYEQIASLKIPEVRKTLEQNGSVFSALEALLRLRQAATDPRLLKLEDHQSTGAKLEVLLEKLETVCAQGHRALVFSQWTQFLDLIGDSLTRVDLKFSRLDGQSRNRDQIVENFQSSDGPPVMLLSLKAGGVGLNLTAADHVFLMDPWWNPATEAQAADRAHRIGQTRPVMVYRLLTRNTVEEAMERLKAKKRELADLTFADGDRALSLGKDDILKMLDG